MPSTRPRMALTLPDDVHRALFELADATSQPASKVVIELLEGMVPQLIGMAKVARALKAGKHAAAKTAIRHMMGDAFAQVLSDREPDLFKAKARK